MPSQFSFEAGEEEFVAGEQVRAARAVEAPESRAALVDPRGHQKQPSECNPRDRFRWPLESALNYPRPDESHGSAPNWAR